MFPNKESQKQMCLHFINLRIEKICFLAILSKFPISFSCLLSSIYYILGKSPQIASLSFGDTRAFELRQNPEDPVSILRVIYFISKLKQKKN